MVYSPGIDWTEKIDYEYPEADWDIDVTDSDEETYSGIPEFCCYLDGGWLPNSYCNYNDAAKAIYDYLKETNK